VDLQEIIKKINQNKFYWIFYLIVIAGIIYFKFYSNSSKALLPPCIIYKSTGLYCGGCGIQRGLLELSLGHFLNALRFNVLFILGSFIFLIDFIFMLFGIEKYRPVPFIFTNNKMGWFVFIGVFLFIFLRNIPFSPFNALAPH
jgi:hypothetical protein